MEVTRPIRDNRQIVTFLALAFALAAGFLPAAALSGSEGVVCVGSGNRIHQVKPDPKDLHGRHGPRVTESGRTSSSATRSSDLSSELGSYPEVWCAWSDPGDDHTVIIRYTGVIRRFLVHGWGIHGYSGSEHDRHG